MKQNSIDKLIFYFFTVIFISACVIGGIIGGNKLSELRDKNIEENKRNIISEIIDPNLEAYIGTEINLNDVIYCTDCNYNYIDRRDNSIKSIIVNKDNNYSININDNIIKFDNGNVQSISTLFVNNNLYFIFKIIYEDSGESIIYSENGELVKKLSNSENLLSYELLKFYRGNSDEGDYYLIYYTCDSNTLNYHRLRLSDMKDEIYYYINNAYCDNKGE